MTRVVVEYSPQLFGMLGLHPASECAPTLTQTDAAGAKHVFHRVKKSAHYQLYREMASGGE